MMFRAGSPTPRTHVERVGGQEAVGGAAAGDCDDPAAVDLLHLLMQQLAYRVQLAGRMGAAAGWQLHQRDDLLQHLAQHSLIKVGCPGGRWGGGAWGRTGTAAVTGATTWCRTL